MLQSFFRPNSVAVIGAAREEEKVGHVVLKSIIDSGFQGKIYPINPYANEILNIKCFPSLDKIQEKIELAIITLHPDLALKEISECGKKKIRNIILITSGFGEVGNKKLENKLIDLIKKYKIRMIGPNCLGLIDRNFNFDTIFLPESRLPRPNPGKIALICQSGALGSAMIDLMTKKGHGLSKFISYGNANDITETHLLSYLEKDDDTSIICMYIEGIKDGKNFIKVASKVTNKKPIICLKGGITQEGSRAAKSHTAALAGSSKVYEAVFKQTGIIEAKTIEELFNFAAILEKSPKPNGRKVQIITNGGGYGILLTDSLIQNKLKVELPSQETIDKLKPLFPENYVISNPIDLTGNATSYQYKQAIEQCLKDKKIDIIAAVLLMQTPGLDIDVVDYIIELNNQRKKPIICLVMGSLFENRKSKLEQNGIPTFTYPEESASSIRALCEYYKV